MAFLFLADPNGLKPLSLLMKFLYVLDVCCSPLCVCAFFRGGVCPRPRGLSTFSAILGLTFGILDSKLDICCCSLIDVLTRPRARVGTFAGAYFLKICFDTKLSLLV